jgi:hypothetical protein
MAAYYATDSRELPKDGSVKVWIQILKRPSISGSLSSHRLGPGSNSRYFQFFIDTVFLCIAYFLMN